jgi:septal ring factor EnvC (AmiA/AmiB activator)
MADKEVKFDKDEMKKIEELQQTYVGLQNALGQMGVARIRLEQQINDLNDNEGKIRAQFTETQNKEREFVQSINKKYGDGNLNLESGVFSPKPTEKVVDKTL